MIHAAQFRVLGEQNPRLEHRHADRFVKMDRTIPVLMEGSPRSAEARGSAANAAKPSCISGAPRDGLRRRGGGEISPRRVRDDEVCDVLAGSYVTGRDGFF